MIREILNDVVSGVVGQFFIRDDELIISGEIFKPLRTADCKGGEAKIATFYMREIDHRISAKLGNNSNDVQVRPNTVELRVEVHLKDFFWTILSFCSELVSRFSVGQRSTPLY